MVYETAHCLAVDNQRCTREYESCTSCPFRLDRHQSNELLNGFLTSVRGKWRCLKVKLPGHFVTINLNKTLIDYDVRQLNTDASQALNY